MQNICSVTGCTEKLKVKSYCSLHYQRWRKTGQVGNVNTGPSKIILYDTHAEIELRSYIYKITGHAIIDLADVDKIKHLRWSLHSTPGDINGYAWCNEKRILLHKYLTGYKITDHINNNKLDNRRINLRECTHQQNILNTKARKNKQVPYKGVKYNREKFQAKIMLNGISYNLGTYITAIEAAEAYDKAAIELHGEYACINTYN